MIPIGVQAFPQHEYIRRLEAAKRTMDDRGLDVVVVVDASNITYLTGYTAQSAYVPQAVIVTISEERPTFILRRQDAPAALHQTYLSRDQVIGYPESLIGNPESNGFDTVIEFLLGLTGPHAVVGLEFSCLSTADQEKFRRRLPTRFSDISGVIARHRMVKSELEIQVMRDAAAISDSAVRRASEVLRPGVSESEAAAEIVAQLIRGVNGKSSTAVPGIFLCATPRTGTPHIPWAEDVLRHGSQVNLELSGIRYGYVSPIMRTFSLGPADERLRDVHDAQLAGLEAALMVVEPGRACSDVAEQFYRTAEERGVSKDSRCGYSVGINWLEPTASLMIGDSTVLEPNMTFHLMLGNWMDEDFGYTISETFRVTESGAEVFGESPRTLHELL